MDSQACPYPIPIGVRAVDLEDDLGMDLDEDEGSLDDSVDEGERSLLDSDSIMAEDEEWLVNRLADDTTLNNSDEDDDSSLQLQHDAISGSSLLESNSTSLESSYISN